MAKLKSSKKKIPAKPLPALIKRKLGLVIYWTPRILSIIFILFISMFSLDVFDSNPGFWDAVIGLFMHNLPSFALIIFLIIAWKYEWVGAVGYIGLALLYIVMTAMNVSWQIALSWSMIIAGPAIFIGILFALNWRWKKKNSIL